MNMMKTILSASAVLLALTAVQPAFAVEKAERQQKRIVKLIRKADVNGDQKISRQELASQIARTLDVLDVNQDGGLSLAEIKGQKAVIRAENRKIRAAKTAGQNPHKVMKMPKAVAKRFDKIDANKDGVLSAAEIDAVVAKMFARRDRNKDGYISTDDFAA